MDTDTNQISDTATTESNTPTPDTQESAAESTPVDTDTKVSAKDDGGDEGVETSAPKAPAYTPNYKLKVYHQEKELDDPFLKSLIKDADSEKKVKEIAQKFLGFDTVKELHEKARVDFQQYQQQAQPVVDYYNKASKVLNSGDLDGFFDMLKIPQDVILRYAIQKAEEAQLSPDQRHQIQQQREYRQKAMSLEEQNQHLQTSQQKQLSEFRNQELSWVMARPEVDGVVKAFDEKKGPGSFRQLVVDVALAHFSKTNGQEDLTTDQAVQGALKLIGDFVSPQTATPGKNLNQPQVLQNHAPPPIIPNVSGKASSPVRKQVRSLDDLKKKAAEVGRASG